jgi:hypothetical protein
LFAVCLSHFSILNIVFKNKRKRERRERDLELLLACRPVVVASKSQASALR